MSSESTRDKSANDLTLDFHLLGELSLARFQELQRRLLAAAASARARAIPVILCEHPRMITIGRSGSRSHIRLSNEQLQRRSIAIEWVPRGGGCIPHGPGQLCIYPIVPLAELGWTVGQYARYLQDGLRAAIASLNVVVSQRTGSLGLWGRSGLLAATGIKVQEWVSLYGAYLNVAPEMSLFGFVDTAAGVRETQDLTMSCLAAERRGAVHMSLVRTAVIESLSQSLGAAQHHIHAGHPWLPSESKSEALNSSRRAV